MKLAPAVRQALRPTATAAEAVEDDGDAEGDDDWCCKEGREALSRAVALAADATRRPKPVHGVQRNIGKSPPVHAIPSKFWGHEDDSEESEDEGPEEMQSEPSTPEFIKDVLDAGFTLEQLFRAEQALASGNVLSSDDRHLSKSIISKMVQRKLVGAPWQGPLPSPQVSPPLTLGDFVAKATHSTPALVVVWPRRLDSRDCWRDQVRQGKKWVRKIPKI